MDQQHKETSAERAERHEQAQREREQRARRQRKLERAIQRNGYTHQGNN